MPWWYISGKRDFNDAIPATAPQHCTTMYKKARTTLILPVTSWDTVTAGLIWPPLTCPIAYEFKRTQQLNEFYFQGAKYSNGYWSTCHLSLNRTPETHTNGFEKEWQKTILCEKCDKSLTFGSKSESKIKSIKSAARSLSLSC